MAHLHHCQKCGTPVASCSDEHCVGEPDKGHFCSAHHPDAPPPPDAPARMTVRIAKD